MWHLNVKNCFYRSIFKPGKIVIGHKQFLALSQNPDSIAGDVNLNCFYAFPSFFELVIMTIMKFYMSVLVSDAYHTLRQQT